MPPVKGASLLFAGLAGLGTAALGAAVLSAAVPGVTYRDGPPPGFTGGFGEQSCHACHFAADINETPGGVTIEGVPERYGAGETYPLRVTLTRPGMAVAGFQLAARFESEGAQAGSMTIPQSDNGRITTATDRGVQYAYQLRPGTELVAPDTIRWTVIWTAPSSGGAVAFHVAGIAADGDDSIEGDYVYTADITAEPPKD